MILECKGLSKVFVRNSAKINGSFTNNQKERFNAIKEVSFSVNEGETFSIIGANGSGKSTLLKLICGITNPTAGIITARGRISALLELGVGFHPELNGWENMFLYASILGIKNSEIKKHISDIAEYSGISEFLDTPIKHYSSGMLARLAFATAINVNPDILLIDEILSVGDIEFQARALNKIKEFKSKNKTVIIVTHEISVAQQLSDRILWLHEGSVKEIGNPTVVATNYMSSFYKKTSDEIPFFTILKKEESEDKKLMIRIVRGETGKDKNCPNNNITTFKTGEKAEFDIIVKPLNVLHAKKASLCVLLLREPEGIISILTSSRDQIYFEDLSKEYRVRLTFDPLLLTKGKYCLSAAVTDSLNLTKIHAYSSVRTNFNVDTDNFKYDFFMLEHPARWSLQTL